MLNEIILAIVQAITEFLPISSDGHLSLVSNLISQPNLFFFTVLHMASLLAVMIFTRSEIKKLLKFDKQAQRMWIYIIIATIPVAIFGLLFKDLVVSLSSSYLFIGAAFIFTGAILLMTKDTKVFSNISAKNSFAIGIAQMFAILPGISRSAMTISTAKFLGIKNEEAFKFSFLILIPAAIGAFILELGEAYFSWSLVISFFVCLFLSLIFLNLLYKIVKADKLWIFSFYCFIIGIITIILYFL